MTVDEFLRAYWAELELPLCDFAASVEIPDKDRDLYLDVALFAQNLLGGLSSLPAWRCSAGVHQVVVFAPDEQSAVGFSEIFFSAFAAPDIKAERLDDAMRTEVIAANRLKAERIQE